MFCQFCNFAILQFCNLRHTKISRRVKIDTLKTPIDNLRGPKSEMSFPRGGGVLVRSSELSADSYRNFSFNQCRPIF